MGNKLSNWFQDHETLLMKILRWILFGVGVSMLPFLFMIFRNWLSDLVVMDIDYLPDLLLIIFAISAGAINLLWDSEKKISKIAKAVGVAVLAVVMLCCAVTYASLFEQTIYNNKLLEAYDKLTTSIESVPVDFIDNPEYEKNLNQLTTIKTVISQTKPKSDRLEHLKNISIFSLVAISIAGIVVECFDDKNRRNASNPPAGNGGGSIDPNKKDGE
ncbi:MAG: hypothetical protein K2K56_10090 [Lachnospiraceae bacterium]|nr:hypothetical protein [Lachnospiraceae bacterium]